jgi:hypothetical protein
MKKFYFSFFVILLLPITLKAGGGGGCSWSDDKSTPTSITLNTVYSLDNSGCTSNPECASPYDICSCAPCTNGDCESSIMGAICSMSGCIGGNCGVSIENNMWAQFCPSATGDYVYTVSNLSCSGGGASLQWAFYTNSTWACTSGAVCHDNATANTCYKLPLTGGQCYYIMFDGNAAAACTWNFEIHPYTPADSSCLNPTGIKEFSNDNFNIERIYPAIANDKIDVFISSDNSTQTSIQIFDSKYALVSSYSYKLSRGENKIPLSVNSLNKGTYFVIAEQGGRKKLSRFVKY